MADQNMFPKMKWPETSEGKDKTYVKLTKLPSSLPRDFFEVPVRKGAIPEGSYTNYVFSPRENLVHFLVQKFYDETLENRDRVEFLLRPIDVSPAAIPFAAYDTSRAVGEGRYKDAILPAITAVAPFASKPTKMIAQAVRRRGSMGRMANDLPPSEIAEGQTQSPNQQTIADGLPPSLDQPPSSLPVSRHTTEVPLYSSKRKDPDDIDFTIPAMPWERSSPWVVGHPPLPRPMRDFSLDY
jgi:hypothetical protein